VFPLALKSFRANYLSSKRRIICSYKQNTLTWKHSTSTETSPDSGTVLPLFRSI